MGTFSMLFRMVKGLHSAIFSFLLIRIDFGQKITEYYRIIRFIAFAGAICSSLMQSLCQPLLHQIRKNSSV